MNRQVRQILATGAFLAGTAIVVDSLLAQIPTLAWLAMSSIFSLAAALFLSLVAQNTTRLEPKPTKPQRPRDEFQHLVDIVDAGIFGHDQEALRIVSDRLRSLALGSVAAQSRLSKRELVELAESDPKSFQLIVNDEDLITLLLPRPNLTETALEKALLSIERRSS